MEENGTWLGLALYDYPRGCGHCGKNLDANCLGVADYDGRVYHVRCAAHEGWVASDSEAWTMALYTTASEVPQ